MGELFPQNNVWKKDRYGVNCNFREITLEEAESFYKVIVQHYVNNDISDDVYQTGNFGGSPVVTSNLLLVFDDLLAFFEKELGFTCSEEEKKTIVKKQNEHKEKVERANQEYLKESLDFFETLGVFHQVSDQVIRSKLEKKLEEYKQRTEEWVSEPSVLRANINGYRDTIHKIFLVEEVLKANKEIRIVDLARRQAEEFSEHFDTMEFFNACGVIAIYLGTPFEGTQIATA
jgi:hypothetical protein